MIDAKFSSESCPYSVKPLPYEFCQSCVCNGNYPWNRNPILLCHLMGGLMPAVIFKGESGGMQCASFKLVDEDMWQRHLSDLKREAEWNEDLRKRAMNGGEVKSSELLPAEYIQSKREDSLEKVVQRFIENFPKPKINQLSQILIYEPEQVDEIVKLMAELESKVIQAIQKK